MRHQKACAPGYSRRADDRGARPAIRIPRLTADPNPCCKTPSETERAERRQEGRAGRGLPSPRSPPAFQAPTRIVIQSYLASRWRAASKMAAPSLAGISLTRRATVRRWRRGPELDCQSSQAITRCRCISLSCPDRLRSPDTDRSVCIRPKGIERLRSPAALVDN